MSMPVSSPGVDRTVLLPRSRRTEGVHGSIASPLRACAMVPTIRTGTAASLTRSRSLRQSGDSAPGDAGGPLNAILRFDKMPDHAREALTFYISRPQGLAASDMDAAQRKVLQELLDVYIDRLPEPVKAYWQHERPIEIRPVDFSRYLSADKRAPTQQVWIKATGRLGDDLALHQCVLAYASDFTLLDTALVAHGRFVFDPRLMLASLDHAIWFHRNFRADEWLLYAQDSPSSGAGRAFCRGTLFTREGELVASTAQEGLVRERTARKDA